MADAPFTLCDGVSCFRLVLSLSKDKGSSLGFFRLIGDRCRYCAYPKHSCLVVPELLESIA
jgi:hypothetical protein